MKFDLLYELQMPKPHDARSEYRCVHEALGLIELAERLGFDAVWAVEHHFLQEFARCSAPEVFLAAAAQRSKRIRIGPGVVLLPNRFNHPIRVAERVAMLDLVSGGRVEFGTGRSSQFEQAGFEVDVAQSREMWQEALEIIPRMWTEDPFEYRGRFVTIPPRSIVPRPLQQPHPPIWMAATSPASWEIGGRNGIGILALTLFVSVPQLEDLDAEDMVIVGDVEHCIRKIERYRAAGLDHLICLMQADRIPHAKVMRSIELFGREIIPHFRG